MKKWEDLTEKEQNRVAYNWIQCEGYTEDGEETESAEEYYYATTNLARVLIGNAPFQKGDPGTSVEIH